MAPAAVPFILGALIGSAFTHLYLSKTVRGERKVIPVDAEPVEDTMGLEARFRS